MYYLNGGRSDIVLIDDILEDAVDLALATDALDLAVLA